TLERVTGGLSAPTDAVFRHHTGEATEPPPGVGRGRRFDRRFPSRDSPGRAETTARFRFSAPERTTIPGYFTTNCANGRRIRRPAVRPFRPAGSWQRSIGNAVETAARGRCVRG